ncbi:MAG: SirB1 family protein [Gammaproteobacteria bacterium]|jgi:regulator of sirC expression with transglutaminase-like and TPR domain
MQYTETVISSSYASEVALPEPDLNLARAGLLFARSEYPELDCGWYLGQLDLIASDIGSRMPRDADVAARLRAMNTYLFADLGFSGNVDDYYDPRNSFLNEVIDRRVGLPITLSILYLELAQRLGVPARGISFPGHFLVGVTTEDGDVIVDAFDRGATLPRATFVTRLHERADPDTSSAAIEQALRPAMKVEILLRQLRNLKAVYAERGDVEKTLNTLNHMLIAHPDLLPELLERAALFDTLGYARGAATDYDHALHLLPDGIDREEIVNRRDEAEARAGQLH